MPSDRRNLRGQGDKRMTRRIVALLLRVVACWAAESAAQNPGAANAGGAGQPSPGVQAMQIVDCLLPGQVRVLGRRTYLTPRRPTRTTAADCGARGGEYLAYDRADYRTALQVWQPSADQGDPAAQTTVGEIYEKGLGGSPNYEEAARWYRRAADQGYSRAQFDLGALYEQGLGVPQDRLEALNWYRRASGLGEDDVIFRSAAAAEQAEQTDRLSKQIEQRDEQIRALRRQIDALNERLRERSADAAASRETLASLHAQLDDLEASRTAEQQRLTALVQSLPKNTAPRDVGTFTQPERRRYKRSDFGRFYALIIGVQNYDALEDLASPLNDVKEVGQVLEENYGFSIIRVVDPDQETVMRAVYELNETLDEDDNLLIYFSGYGSTLGSGTTKSGYWLPRNADPAPDDTLWVSNDFVSRHLGRIRAKRILIIADSCYAGLLVDDPGYVMVGDGAYSDDYIRWKMQKRSRLVLSSGGDYPILANADREHSVFARALLQELASNQQVLTAPELFLRIRRLLRAEPDGATASEQPSLKALIEAGHEVGDFFFIPRDSGRAPSQ
jgi:hypothetical protein